MLGDYVAGHHYMVRQVAASEWAAALAKLKAPLGVHAVLGNHDYWDDREVQREGQGKTVAHRALEAAGIPVYENDVARLAKGRHAFWLAGLGDQIAFLSQWRRGMAPRMGVDDLDATLAKVTDNAPVILLAHEPDVAPRVPSRVALQLSGHTHGGQVRLFGWSPVVPSRYGNRLAYGHAEIQLRRDRLRRPRLQHHAGSRRRAPGNRRGDARREAGGVLICARWAKLLTSGMDSEQTKRFRALKAAIERNG